MNNNMFVTVSSKISAEMQKIYLQFVKFCEENNGKYKQKTSKNPLQRQYKCVIPIGKQVQIITDKPKISIIMRIIQKQQTISIKFEFETKIKTNQISGDENKVHQIILKYNSNVQYAQIKFIYKQTKQLCAILNIEEPKQQISNKNFQTNLLLKLFYIQKSINKILLQLKNNLHSQIQKQQNFGLKFKKFQSFKNICEYNIKNRCRNPQKYKKIELANINSLDNEQWKVQLVGHIKRKLIKKMKSKDGSTNKLAITKCIKLQKQNQIIQKQNTIQTTFKIIRKIQANFTILLSFNSETNIYLKKSQNSDELQSQSQQIMNQQTDESQQINNKIKSILIQKSAKIKATQTQSQKKRISNSFQGQIEIIKLLKGIQCQGIAQHYIQQKQKQNKNFNINRYFNNVYDLQLKQKTKFKQKQFFQFFQILINSVRTLIKISIRHRDLKPSNIMMNNHEIKPKIIDFGSALYKNPNKQTEYSGNIQLITTKYYNLKYENAYFNKLSMTEKQYNENQLFDMYAIGILLRDYCSAMEQKQKFSNSIYFKINYLISTCMLHDPTQRLTPEELLYFLIIIKSIWKNTINNK